MGVREAVQAFMDGTLDRQLVNVLYHPTQPLVLLTYTDMCARANRWDEVTRFCRGLILNAETGEVVALPFPKFFDLGYNDETQIENLPVGPFTATEKVDGSLGIFYWDANGLPCLATQRSFVSPQAVVGTTMLRELPGINEFPRHLTALFEIICHDSQEIVDYGEVEELVLLGVFNRVTGKELSLSDVQDWARILGVRTAQVFAFLSIEEMLTERVHIQNMEGWVIRFENGLRVKLKGDAYKLARKMKLGISRKKIFQALSQGSLEKYLMEVDEEFHGDVGQIARHMIEAASEFEKQTHALLATAPQGDRGQFAKWVNTQPKKFQSVLFQLASGKSVEWIKNGVEV